MRAINIDITKLITVAVSNGAISAKDAAMAVKDGMNPETKLGLNNHCGHFRTELGMLGSMFIATDRKTGMIRRSQDNKRVRFNFRLAAAKEHQANQTTQTLNQVLVDNQPSNEVNQLAVLLQNQPQLVKALQNIANGVNSSNNQTASTKEYAEEPLYENDQSDFNVPF